MMDIKELKVTIGEVCEGYFNDAEEGVVGYDERLDIRPKYQREFVYKDAQRDEVIRTVMKGLPLNVIYWCKVKKDDGSDGFEVLDGQQRTISVCEYVDGSFSVDDKYFYNLPKDKKEQILNYPLFVYVCDGTDSEKLEWFRIINIAGERLTDQELRNAVYAGSWTSDAKRYFSKTGCAADTLGGDYLKGSSIRQEYLETAILWAASAENKSIEAYMAEHQNDPSAVQLWNYFRSGKWQFWGDNQFAHPGQWNEYEVPVNSLRLPNATDEAQCGWRVIKYIKWLFGQKIYEGPPQTPIQQ